jgi:YHS domain-containing protein
VESIIGRRRKNKTEMRKPILITIIIIAIAACNNQQHAETKTASPGAAATTSKAKFTTSMVDNKIDLSCGMPLTAGIEDTCHYNGKVYGFCSKECKDEFVKNPAGAIKEK